MEQRRFPAAAAPPVPDPAQRNVETVARLEQAAQTARTLKDRVIGALTSFVGSLPFLYVHLFWFALWVAWNGRAGPRRPFDPFPFPLLTMVLAMETILLSTLVLISQNRQQRLADRRAHLDLQINLLAEQEITKVLEMLEEVQKRLGLADHDPEVAALKQAVKPEELMEQIEQQVDYLEETPKEG
jgi:uncharacterized membrane protein